MQAGVTFLASLFAACFCCCHAQAQGEDGSAVGFPDKVQVYFPQKTSLSFLEFPRNDARFKKLFLVNRGRTEVKDGSIMFAKGKTYTSASPNIKVVAKIVSSGSSSLPGQSTLDGLSVSLTAAVEGQGVVDVHVTTVGLASKSLTASKLSAKQALIAASGRPLDEEARAKGEFNVSMRCVGRGQQLIRLTVSVEPLVISPQRHPTAEVHMFIRRACGTAAPTVQPTTQEAGEDVETRPNFRGFTPPSRETPAITKYSAGIAAVGLIATVVFSILIYLWCQRSAKRAKRRRRNSPRVEFNADDNIVHVASNSSKRAANGKSKNAASANSNVPNNQLHSQVRQQDSLSYGDVQSNVITQRSTLSGVTGGAHAAGNGEEGEDDEHGSHQEDGVDAENNGEGPDGSKLMTMSDPTRPASLNSDESMSSVAPLITVHATYPWQYHSVFHGCIIDKDRIQIGQIVKQGSYGQVFEGTLGYPERLPIIVKTSTQSAHQDEIQRLAFEAMVLKGAVHKYVHSVVGICFASTATNGVPVPPFLIFPMVPGQKSLKDLLLHTRRVAGIRDSSTDAGNGSVGRAGGKMLSTPQLVMMAAQIARGLRHLEKRNIVHKDVATRNCVVLPNLEVRIGDAALSCDLYPNEYHYHFNFGHAKVPLKWMPLECIEDGHFSGSSDAWAFGVTMWEIMTLGSLPFEDVDELDLSQHLRNGHRLQQPRRCPFELFAIMARCWALSPEDRPGFGFLVHALYTYADTLRCYI
ncbi:probable serine/threonine-protein kinase DDB_G0267514 [Sycon ciliatum]|uniref:probable serine/threonine-protein kinase DDB_G0267514 n=1 Tax=Sycon ciliatum TaxID=27933 RepID=UPI0020A8DA30|eukprot:scpid36875/ scgid10944/ Tyrosine-protein kinase Dnt; Protein doughnut